MKWLHNLLKGASLTTALFIFQACYGIRQPYFDMDIKETPMSFSLVSAESGEALHGIHILCKAAMWLSEEGYQDIGVTDENGKCKVNLLYSSNAEGPYIRFEDPEGVVAAKDTTLADLRERDILVKMKSRNQ